MTNRIPTPPDARTVIVGVDTHKHVHVAVAIDSWGIRLRDHAFVVDSGGYQALITWAETHGRIDAFGIEGTGSYGVGLARAVRRAGHRVVEVNRGDRRTRRAAGKSDTLDAEVAARSVLAGQSTAIPKTADGAVEMMRQLKITRDTAVKARTTAMNTMNPGPLDGTDPGPGTSSPRASSQTDRSTPMAIRPWSSMRSATRPSYPVLRRRGRGTRPPGRSCDGRDAAGARGPLSHDPDVVLAGQRSRGQGWDRVIGAVSSHRRAARASLLRNAPSRSRHRRRLVGRAAGLSRSVGAWQTWPMKSAPPSYHGYRFPPRS